MVLAGVAALLVAGTFAARLALLQTRAFDPDEFQHLHAAWLVHQGGLPYRDFFEHHMPGIQYLLAIAMDAARPATADDVVRFAFVARLLMWPFAVVAVLATMRVGAALGGGPVAWTSGALLATSIVFIGRTLEIRPDTPALAFWLATLAALITALDPQRASSRRAWFAAAGLSLGCALVFNQKLLLAGPGFAVFAVWLVFTPGSERRSNIADVFAVAAGCMLPLAGLALWFWAHGALIDLVNGSLLNNLGWPREVSASSTLRWMLLRDPLFSGIAVAGLVHSTLRFARGPWRDPLEVPLLLTGLSLLAGLAITPAPYPQYMLLIFPMGAAFGAQFLWLVLVRLSEGAGARTDSSADLTVAGAAGLAVAAGGLSIARPLFVNVVVYPAFGLLSLVAVWVAIRRHAAAAAAAIVLLACSAYSVQQLRWMQGLSNAEEVAEMRFVLGRTAPDDTVLDGFTGVAWFRPSATHVPFFHSGVRARLSPREVDAVVGVLEACATRPRLVILDTHLQALSPRVAPAVTRDYEPTPFPSIWTAKEPCAR